MTYRRLFLWLCLAGFFMLAGAWWSSLRYYSCVMIGWPLDGSSVSLFSGNLGIDYTAGDLDFVLDQDFFVIPADRVFPRVRDKHGPLGAFEWKSKSFTEKDGWGNIHIYQLYLPLWFLYIAFVAIAYLALRRPMRKQRLLEEQVAIPSNSRSGE